MAESNRGKITWRCPSNIALVKYWGKHGDQMPNNPSLSITLHNAYTETSMEYAFDEVLNNLVTTFSFGRQSNELFENRINRYLFRLVPQMPFLNHMRIQITSQNNFPHSAGIASSASAFGTLALCLCSIEEQLFGSISGHMDFEQKASYLARMGSGSACRSLFKGYVLWGLHHAVENSSDNFGIPVNDNIHEVFKDMQDSILIVSSERKKVSSSEGHALMDNHAYAKTRYQLASSRIQLLMEALQTGNMEQFIHITEAEALGLHALMMLSEKNYMLLKPNTLAIIEKVQSFRVETKLPVCFTLDAGPNIHLLYPAEYKEDIQQFIRDELLQFCEHNQWIHDHIGQGPVQILE
jgi:diphosphomevalonate decarboxylase